MDKVGSLTTGGTRWHPVGPSFLGGIQHIATLARHGQRVCNQQSARLGSFGNSNTSIVYEKDGEITGVG